MSGEDRMEFRTAGVIGAGAWSHQTLTDAAPPAAVSWLCAAGAVAHLEAQENSYAPIAAAAVRRAGHRRLFVLAAIGLFAAALAQTPWMMLFVISAAYTAALPFATLRYASLRKAERSADGAA